MNLNKQTDLTRLTTRLKHEDNSYARLCKTFKNMYWGFVIIYVILAVFHLFTDTSLPYIIRSICFCLAMASFAFIFQKLHLNFKNIDYSLPTLEMLKNAKKRYAPYGAIRPPLLLILPIILIDVALSVSLSGMSVGTFQLIYFGVVLLVVAIGLFFWKIKYKPLYDNVSLMIKEFSE